MYDVAILGGGPAGLSAAITARARNKSVVVISNHYRANPLYRAQEVPNYPGLPDISGSELLRRMHDQAVALGAEMLEKRLISISDMGGSWFIGAEDAFVEASAVILAGGVVRGSKFPGEEEYLGRGVSYCATCDGMLYRGKNVVVYGESEKAEEEAAYLQEIGCTVVYVSRKGWQGVVREQIPFLQIKKMEIGGAETVTHVMIDDQRVLCDGVFLLRSAVSPMDLLPGLAVDGGHIRVDREMKTNIPGIFAAGDCVGQPYQIAKATGEGQVAVLSAVDYLNTTKGSR